MDQFDKLIQKSQNKHIVYKSPGYVHPKPEHLKGYMIENIFYKPDEFNKITHKDCSMFGT